MIIELTEPLPERVNDLFKALGTTRLLQVVMTHRLILFALGCTVGKLSSQDLRRLGLPESAGNEKRAVLKVPLTFPKPKLRRRA